MSLKRRPTNPPCVTVTLNLEPSQPLATPEITFTVVRVSLAPLAVMVSCPLLSTNPILVSGRINVTITDR